MPVDPPNPRPPAARASREVEAFLSRVQAMAPAGGAKRGRLVFALDATMSRQPSWDLACTLQAEMFEEAASIGGLDVQLVYYRGLSECRSSPWAGDARRLGALMAHIDCRGGRTQIGRVLAHAAGEAGRGRVDALVFVGDAIEEPIDALCTAAGELALRGVPVFLFQEGRDVATERGFRELARLTRGAWCRFDAGAAAELRALLRAVAAYAAGGAKALERLSASGEGSGARRLIAAMRGSE